MSWQAVLLAPAKSVLTQIGQFLASALLVLIILVIGWLISKLIKTAVTALLRAIRLDTLSDRIELDNILAKGGIKYSLSELIGIICYWLALLVTFMVAINAIGLTVAAELVNRVVLYIPNIIIAIFILVLGIFVAALLKNIVLTVATNSGLAQAKPVSRVAEIAVVIFAVLIALEQLNIGARIIQLVVGITLGSLGLGLALAIGLGCKDMIARMVAEFLEKMKK